MGSAVRGVGKGVGTVLISTGSGVRRVQGGASDGLEKGTSGRKLVMDGVNSVVNNTVADTLLQKELVRKLRKGTAHNVHTFMDGMVQTAATLPPAWKFIYLAGVIGITILGFTVHIWLPFAFTILLVIWTSLIVKVAGKAPDATLEERFRAEFSIKPGEVSNPMFTSGDEGASDDESDDDGIN